MSGKTDILKYVVFYDDDIQSIEAWKIKWWLECADGVEITGNEFLLKEKNLKPLLDEIHKHAPHFSKGKIIEYFQEKLKNVKRGVLSV